MVFGDEWGFDEGGVVGEVEVSSDGFINGLCGVVDSGGVDDDVWL